MGKYYVTTPIYYINDKPHIGHVYSTIAADALARYFRQYGNEVKFVTGTDENSQKTVNAAEATGQSDVKKYADQMAELWQKTWQSLNISFDDFIRTTEERHIKAVYAFLEKVQTSGDIYKGEYEGLYCVGHEAFLQKEDLVDGKCPDHNKEPELVKEENYFFKLSKYQDALLEHIKNNPDFIQPETRRNEVVAFIESGLQDISISRKTRKWGIPFPGDDEQRIYVWFDALINYLTAVGFPKGDTAKWWPADTHVVGKDIIKFHCTIWPAMLLSAGLPLPKQVVAHGFYTVNGTKISKSLGNAIDPIDIVREFGNDALRYYLLREIPFGNDGDFSTERFLATYNADLANDLGNLVQRVLAMLAKYQSGAIGEIPKHSHDVMQYHEAVRGYRFERALEEVWELIRGLNRYIDEEKPWEIAKSADNEHLSEVMAYLVSNLLQVAELLLPFMPETADKIKAAFSEGIANPNIGILFPRKEQNPA